MRALPCRKSWSYAMLQTWVIAWILAVPLFHVHPEADHHHGEAGHVHGGTVHTVFSRDLDGEFDDHQQDTTDGVGHLPARQIAVSGHPSHILEYAELGFSFLSDSTDRNLPKPLFTHTFVVEAPAIRVLNANPSLAQNLTSTLLLTVLTHDIPSRAPPSLLV